MCNLDFDIECRLSRSDLDIAGKTWKSDSTIEQIVIPNLYWQSATELLTLSLLGVERTKEAIDRGCTLETTLLVRHVQRVALRRAVRIHDGAQFSIVTGTLANKDRI
jgi:hypothetical protein